MPSLFCFCGAAAAASQARISLRLPRGCAVSLGQRRRGGRGIVAGKDGCHRPAGHDAYGAGPGRPQSGWIRPFPEYSAFSGSMAPFFQSLTNLACLRSSAVEMFFALFKASQGSVGLADGKGPPARSRWPLISRREAAAYSPATAFWCSAMTLSATGWGASS